jgi:hypothetical protein
MVRFSAFTLASLAGAVSALAVDHVVPTAYSATAGGASFLGPLASSDRTYQLLIHSDELTALVGQDLTGLTWRLLTSATAPWPSAQTVFAGYDVYLSASVAPASRSLTFASNVAGTQTQVRAGTLIIPPGAYTSGGSPNTFGPVIQFDQPWNYAGGHLLVELRHTGGVGGSTSVDAAGTSTAGYATLYSACWTGDYAGTAGTQGNFSVVQFRAAAPGATGACCMPNGTCSDGTTFAACRTASGVWGGQDSQCASAACPQPGACCFPDGTCSSLTTGYGCLAAGGLYQGDATTCAAANCPQPGACCAPDGTCSYVLQSLCTAPGTAWHGASVACAAVSCPVFLATPNPTSTSTLANSGIFFDLTASTALNLTQIDYFPNAAAGASVTADVYYKTGTYVGNDTNAGAWTHLPTYATTSVGGTTTPTALVLPSPIPMATGEIIGVYVVGTVGGLRYRSSTSANPVSNAQLNLESNLYRSGVFAGTATTGRRFAGWVHYTTSGGPSCYANCDGSTTAPVLNVADFTCFLNKFASGDLFANCDGSTAAPVLNVADFTCFLNKYAAGCP